MNKILFLLFFLITLFSFSSKGIYADTGSDVIKRLDSDISISNALFDKISAETVPNVKFQILTNEIPNLINHFNESSSFYLQLANAETDDSVKVLLQRLSATTQSLSENSKDIQLAIQDDNETAYNTALNNYDSSSNDLNNELKEVNSRYASGYDWLPWAFWFTLATSLILFLISRGNSILPAEKLRDQFEFALFKSSLWPFGGAAISYGWQLITPPGETYYVLTWLIGIGYLQFARGLYSYIRYARPAIEAAKKEEQGKLEKLISSDKFDKESLKEKAKEISKMSPVINIAKKSCSSCGARNSNNAKYCKNCGQFL